MSGPAALVVPAIKRHTATVIVAHGLGDSYAPSSLALQMYTIMANIADTICIEELDGKICPRPLHLSLADRPKDMAC
jgi:hypothetical protein